MRLPCWNFTGGAFAVFGCFAMLKCCGLIGLPAATPVAPLLPVGGGLDAPSCLPVFAVLRVLACLAGPFAPATSAALPACAGLPLCCFEPFVLWTSARLAGSVAFAVPLPFSVLVAP